MNKTEKIEKIKKLLALAGNNPEKNEAERAMFVAQKLMSSEGISAEDIANSTMDDELGELGEDWLNEGEEKQLYNWKKVLISNLAYFFDCKLINYPNGRKCKLLIVGRESNRITCEMFYNWLHDRTMKEAKEIYGNQTAKRNSYCVGVANGIAVKIHEIKPSKDVKNGWGIVPLDEVEQFMKEKHSNLSKGKSISTTVRDGAAAAAGRKVGENTSLNHQFGLKAIGA